MTEDGRLCNGLESCHLSPCSGEIDLQENISYTDRDKWHQDVGCHGGHNRQRAKDHRKAAKEVLQLSWYFPVNDIKVR